MLKLTIGAIVLVILIAGCGSGNSVETLNSDLPNSSEQPNLLSLDVFETQSEIIRLLDVGYVMYFRSQMFNSGGLESPACIVTSSLRSDCNTWPETVIRETWETMSSSGGVDQFYGRNTTLDGTVLATGINGEWTDSRSADIWTEGPLFGPELLQIVEALHTTIERVATASSAVIESVYLGRPSVVVPGALESEYQVANPMIWRQTRWSENDDGTRFVVNESKVVDFAMLPPGSFPDLALASED